ncbi:MAG: hypothetical protein M1821_005472 [Bathelium mastoideum]|nr:MAG: hypothetical protein M1821_005472 [Bathelium mastoideum]
MRSTFTSAAILGVSCISSLVAGAPLTARWEAKSDNSSDFKFPLGNGFPSPNQAAKQDIEEQARGTLPNGAAPTNVSPQGLANLRLLAFGEIFEVAYFTQLLHNVTHNVIGFREEDLNGYDRNLVINELTATQAQEELHALDVNGALEANNQLPIVGCEYNFGVHNFSEAIATAATFTDVVLGTLQDVNQIFAQNNDDGLVRAISSVIGQEGEQNGFYRILQAGKNLIPNQLPFLTTAARNFAFTAILGFTLPNTCPQSNITAITNDLHAFIPMKLETSPVPPQDQDLVFSFSLMAPDAERYRQAEVISGLSMVYINQQNTPIVEPIKSHNVTGDNVLLTAHFPYSTNFLNGLTIAAVAMGNNFTSADDVAANALIAPGLIEIN